MNKQYVKFGLRTYEKIDNILEHVDDKGFKTQIIFDKNKCDKTKEQLHNEFIIKLLKN